MAYKRSIYRKRQAGQSVIIAIAVMFILAFIAALFTILIARNFERVTRSSETLTADFYAQGGVEYADQMLTTSAQGADWRPPLQYKLDTANICALNGAAGSYSVGSPDTLSADEGAAYVKFLNNYYNSQPVATRADFPVVNSTDPDEFWLLQGFTRYNTQGGRFLIRLSYGTLSSAAGAAVSSSPYDGTAQSGKYIKIESIGRTGEVDPTDPTTFMAQPIRLHAELVAYKPIGLVDYARFITNKYQRSDTASLGVPSLYDSTKKAVVTPGVYDFDNSSGSFADTDYPLVTTYGVQTTSTDPTTASGGSLRSNTSLRLDGMNYAYLNNKSGDDWEIAGNLTFDGYSGPTDAQAGKIPSALYVTGSESDGTSTTAAPATPTNIADPAFGGTYDSIGGLIRDGSDSGDANGFPRSIKRLNPPSLDTIDSASSETRYAELASIGSAGSVSTGALAGPYSPISTSNPSQPATVFIDNANDMQPESTNVGSGAATLRDDWLNRVSTSWEGPFYNPPGATIVFGPINLTVGGIVQSNYWGFTVTRTDYPVGIAEGQQGTWQWKTSNGTTTTTPLVAPQIEFVYGAMPTGFTQGAANGNPIPVCFLNADTPQSNNDVVIYAEGNVRVRGVVSDPRTTSSSTTYPGTDHHVTVVTNQIAYVEGSILKGGPNYQATSYTSGSSMAILAERYCCLNTTQFLAGADVTTDLGETLPDPETNSIIFSGNSLTEAFDLPPTSLYGTSGATNGTEENLYLSQYAENAGTSLGLVALSLTNFGTATATLSGLADGATTTQLQGSASNPNRLVLGMSSISNFATTAFATTSGYNHFDLTFAKSPSSVQDYLLERAAILPSDVRIEAVLYAQNNSFFVIPGPWFNSDSKDTVDQFVANNYQRARPLYLSNPDEQGQTDKLFPFYGQPIDMKISVVGSVVENLPANISDQTAWMMKWGWIPKYHGMPTDPDTGGTSQDVSPHPSLPLPTATTLMQPPEIGLNMQYDPIAGTGAYTPTTTGTAQYARLDTYGRPLPYVPDLPVSPDLLYSGATSGNSLVQ